MGKECFYSFNDLLKASGEKGEGALRSLMHMSQEDRNKRVTNLAKVAGWETEERIGTDGVKYVAFCPSFDE